MNQIITIGREFGSGGRELGRKLAEELHIAYYDKEIITEIAKHIDMSEEYVAEMVEKKPSYLFPTAVSHSFSVIDDYQIRQMKSFYQAQSDIIHQLAERSSAVFIGRCADYILRDLHPFRIFVYAAMESRMKRCFERSGPDEKPLTEKEVRTMINRIDKGRARHYSDFTGRKWGGRINYDLLINTTYTEIDRIIPYLARMLTETTDK